MAVTHKKQPLAKMQMRVLFTRRTQIVLSNIMYLMITAFEQLI